MKAQLNAMTVCVSILVPSCHQGSKDFAESIGQCERIISYMVEYEKTFSRSPSGLELRDFIEKSSSGSGYRSVRGWTFYEAGSKHIATKNNIKNLQGSYADISILPTRKYIIVTR